MKDNGITVKVGESISARKLPEDEDGPFSLGELPRDHERIDRAVEMVADAEGDLCIAIYNVGATPYLRPTPYENNRGVLVRMWSCISVYPKAMPGKTMLFGRRSPLWPDEKDDYNVRMFTKEWVRAQLRRSTQFEVVPAEESPFCTDWYDWNWENREGPDAE